MTVKITLVNPPPHQRRESHDTPGYPHLGLAYIGGYLRSKKINCTLIDAKFEIIDLDEVERRLYEQKPDIVGITAMTHDISQADKLARIVKGISSEITTVIGGPHATALPYKTLLEFSSFDIVVFGEGEHTFYELVSAIEDGKKFNGIKGIGYREGMRICINNHGEVFANLENLPFPAWDLFPKSTKYPIITTRGCPFKCIFCMRVMGNKVRKRTPQNVVKEIEEDVDLHKAKYIILADDLFTFDKKYTNGILNLMIEKGLNKKMKWETQTRVDLVDYELLKKMKDAGCTWVGFGVESGNEEILKATKKGITLNQAFNAIKMAKKAGLKTGSYFILGHPFETYKTACDTINVAKKLNTTTVAFGIMVPYPGTEVYEIAKDGLGGYKILSHDWSDYNKTIGNSLELKELSRSNLEKLQLLGYLKFYLFNYRIIDFIKLFKDKRRIVLSVVKKILNKK